MLLSGDTMLFCWGYLGIPGDTTFFWVGIPGDTWGYLGIPGDTWGYLGIPGGTYLVSPINMDLVVEDDDLNCTEKKEIANASSLFDIKRYQDIKLGGI